MEKISRAQAKEDGKKQYFTGYPCKYGHVAARFVNKNTCVECSRLRCKFKGKGIAYAEAYEKHVDQIVASSSLKCRKRSEAKAAGETHYFTGKPCVNGHIEKRTTSDGHCIKCHRDIASRQYHSDPKRHIARQIETVKKNPEIYRAIRATRRARIKGAEGKFTKKDIINIFNFQNGKCCNCYAVFGKYEIDHIMPLFLGGSNWPDNLQLLCEKCNRSKGSMHPALWKIREGWI